MCFLALSNAFGAVTWYLNEDFESGSIPTGWKQEVVSSNVANWAIEARGVSEYPDTTGNSSNYHMALRNQTEFSQHYVTVLVTPKLNMTLSSVVNPQLVFKHAQVGAGALFDTLKVYCRASETSPWTLLRAYDSRIDLWTEDTIALIGFSGSSTYQIGFEANENMGRGIVLDDVRIMEASNCVAPSNVSVRVPGTTSVTLAWAGSMDTDTFEVVVSAAEITDWSSYTAAYHGFVTDFQTVVSGLTHSTDYYAYVRSKCYDNETGWTKWAKGTFRTRARLDLPHTENFSSEMPEGWVRAYNLTSAKPSFSAATATKTTLASFSVDSTFAMQFGSITAGKYAIAITPEVNLPSLQGVEVGFWGYANTYIETPHNTNIAKMYLGVMNDPEDSASLVIVDSVEIKVASKHQYFNVPLDGYQGTGKYLAFIVSDPKRTGYFYIDHLTISQPAVLTPTNVQISNATPDGFDVTVRLHGATTWNLRVASAANYRHMNIMPTSFLHSKDGITSATYHVTGEFGEQIVSVYAQAVSGSNTSAWSFPTTLRIPARASLPLAYEFDNSDDASVAVKDLDNEIHIVSSAMTYPGLYFELLDLTNFYPKASTATPKYNSTNHMLLQGTGRWMALPYVDTFDGQMISFRLAAATAGQSRVAVGIMRDAYNPETFTQLAVFDGTYNEYTKCEVDLSGKDALGHYVAIMAIRPSNPSSSYGSVNHIDALHIEAIPPCPEAMEIEATIADTAISLTWNGRGKDHWLVELFHGTKQDSLLASVDVTTPAAVITGLTSLTDYYYRVNTICGNDTILGGKVKFTTKCDLVSDFPWSEDFEDMSTGNVAVSCWDNEHTAGTATTKFSISTTAQGGNSSKKLYLATMAAGNLARLSLPEMVLPNNNYEFVISMYRNSLTNTKTGEGLRIFASDGENEVELAFIPRLAAVESEEISAESADDWYTYELPIPMSGMCRIIIQGESESGTAIYADNLAVRQCPTCISVKKLTISNIAASSVTASWTPRGSETQWQYVLTAPGEELNWANAVLVNSSTVSITGLNGSSSYDLHVRAYCGASDQSEAVTKSFSTACGPITAMPWGEGFEAYAVGSYSDMSLPCWSALNAATTSSSTYPQVFVNNSSTYVKTGSKSLYFKSSSAQYVYAVFPAISLPLNTLKIAFWHREENINNSGFLGIGYLTDPADASTFVLLKEFSRLNAWQQEELILSGVPAEVATTARLAFRYGGGPSNNYYVGIDDITLTELNMSCPGLTEVTATAPTSSSISIAWAAAAQLPVNIEVSDSANFSVVRTFSGVETSPLVLDSLEENHRYYVRARQACDSEGEWKSAVAKTLCNPVDPATYPVQDFQNANDLDCWMVGVSMLGKQVTADPTINSSAALGKYLYFNKAATTSDTITKGDGLYAIMPMLDVDSIKGYEIAFKAFKTSTAATNAGKLTVGVITDPTDFSTFTAVQMMRLEYAADSLAAKSYTVNFLDYEGDYNGDYGKYVVFLALSGDSANAVGVDNVEVRAVENCPQLAEGSISDVVSDGATYHWVGNGATAYEVALYTEQIVDPELAEIEPVFVDTVSADSIIIRGISPARVYFAYVRALCGAAGVSRWSTYSRFRTDCGQATIPFAETLDDTQALKCFKVGNKQSSAASYTPSLQTTAAYLYNSAQVLRLYAYNASSTHADSAYVILPEMNFGTKGLKGHTVSFYGRSYGSTTSYYKHLQVGVVAEGDSTFSSFQMVKDLVLEDTHKLQEVSFDAYNGNGNRIALLAVVDPTSTATTKYCYAYLDDITVFETPACKAIASLKATAGRRTIDVTITPKDNGTPDHYDLVCSTIELNNAALEAAEKISVDTTGLYTITGLNRETQYYIYARANCGAEDGTSEWSSVAVETKGLYGCDDYEGLGLDATTTNAMLPMSSNYNYGVYEQIYTAAEIGRAGRIGTLSFFNTGTTKSRRFEMYMIHTTKQEFSSTSDWATITAADKVFAGEMEFVSGEWTTITLDKVFEYDGTRNLLLVVHNYTGSYSSGMSCKTFAGTNQALYKQQDTGDFDPTNMTAAGSRLSVKNQLLVGFCYDLDPCPVVTDLRAELLGAGIREAMVRWTASEGDYLSGYDVIVSDTVVAYPDSVVPTYANVQGDSLHVTGLSPETLYHVYVRAICKAEGHDEGNSVWVDTTFETLANCPAVVDLTSELYTAATTVKVSWAPALEDQALSFAYVYSTDSLDAAAIAAAEKHYVNDTTACAITGLAYDQTYHIYVASSCGDKFSPWTETVIHTDLACAPVRNLQAARVEHNRVVLSWNRSRFGSETQWEAGIVGDSTNVIIVNDTAATVSAMLIGLNAETRYTAYVRTVCGEGEMSEADTVSFTTHASFSGCVTVGEGTTDGYNAPFNNFYKNAWTQMIYSADQIEGSGQISSILFNCAAASSTVLTQNVTIYMAHTDMALSNTTTDWVPQSDLVQVYSNAQFTHPTTTGWVEIVLDVPFSYNGRDNLAVVISTHADAYLSALHYAYTAGTSGVIMYRRSDTDASYGEYPGTAAGTKATYLPNAQFCFVQTGGCSPVTALTVKDITTSSAVASWEPMGTERSWEVYLADTVITDFTGLQVDTAYHYVYPMSNLQEDKDYWFYVRPVCGGDWKEQPFTTVAICSAPIELDYDSVTSEHALLSWTDAFSVGNAYIVAYGLADSFDLADPTTYQTIRVTTPYTTITGLEEVTMYSFAVRSECENGLVSRFSDVVSFQTPCAVKPLNWLDSFEKEVYCWYVGNRQSSTSTYIPSIISSATTASNAVYVHTGVRAFKMYAYKYTSTSSSTNADSAYVIVPEIDYGAAGLQGATARFYARSYGTSTAYYKHVQVGVIKNRNIRTYQKVKDITLTDHYEMYEVPFTNYTGDGDRIVFLAMVDPTSSASTRYSYVYFDDFQVISTPTCWRPASVTVVSTAADSATIRWTAGASETQWQYVCVPFGTTPDWTNAVLVDTTTATVHGLSPATSYEVYVRGYCSATDQSEARSTVFSTECGIVTAIPWTDGFEAYEAGTYSATAATYVPPCWDMVKSAAATNYPHVAEGGSYSFPHSGNNALVTYTTDSCLATLPKFAANLSDLQITFYYRNYNTTNCGYLVLGYVTTDSVFHAIKQFNPVDKIKRERVLLNMLPDSVDARLAFLYTGGTSNMYNISLDDITVDYLNPNCPGVKDVRVSNINLSSGTVEWGYALGNKDAQVQIASDVDFENVVDSAALTNDSLYVVTGLQAATTYYVRARQICGGGEFSEWTDPVTFRTSYGVPFVPQFESTTVPSDWSRSNTMAAQVFTGASMDPTTSGWVIAAADTVFNDRHLRAYISGTTWHYWMVTPSIDMTQNVGQGLVLRIDAAMVAASSAQSKMYTGDDDRFLVAVSTDDGETWNPANVTEWNNSGTGNYLYNDIPVQPRSYYINMSDYAGHVIKVGFYGESSVTNATNYLHLGNVSLQTVETTNYLDTLCEGNSFNKHGFTIPYEQLPVGLNTFSRYETNPDGTLSITIQQVLVSSASEVTIPVTLCEGEHFNDYGFDVTVTKSEEILKRMDNGNMYHCDSTAILQITMLPTIRTEIHVGCNEDSYTWNGKTYYQSTIVDDTTSSAVTGCDSITTLYLTFCDGSLFRYHNAFCAGGSYSDEFFQNLTAPGVYTGSITDEIGCVTNAELTLRQLASGQDYVDSVLVKDLPYVLGGDTLCPETDQPGFVYHGSKDFGCGMVNVTIYVVERTALNNVTAGMLTVAPNPVRIGEDIKILTAVDLSSDYSCRVFDAVGKLVYETDEPSTVIPGLPTAGAYTVRIAAGNKVYQAKLIVK